MTQGTDKEDPREQLNVASGEPEKIDRFEFAMAVMLGLGAVGGAWSSYQADLWGGKQAEEYGLASKEMARAASTMSEAAAVMGEASSNVTEATSGISQLLSVHSHNVNLDVQAKEHLIEGSVALEMAKVGVPEGTKVDNPVETEKHFYVAKYLYAVQMDEDYYLAMGFPAEFRGAEKFDQMPDAVLEEKGSAEIPDSVVEKALEAPNTAIEAANKAYEVVAQKQGEAATKQKEADDHFQEGGRANTIGDNLGFTGVLYTVALFLAGIGLVFKTRVRWGFAGIGLLALVGATLHLFMQTWAPLP